MSIVSIVFNGTSVDGLTISHWQATSLVLKNGTVGFGTESACVYGNHGNGLEQGYIIWKSSFPIRIVRMAAFCRKSYWRMSQHPTVHEALSDERLFRAGYPTFTGCYVDFNKARGYY